MIRCVRKEKNKLCVNIIPFSPLINLIFLKKKKNSLKIYFLARSKIKQAEYAHIHTNLVDTEKRGKC